MRKSIPVSDDLAAFFTEPCPVLSDNNSRLILDEIAKGYDWVVEYGTGASTLYFLPALPANGKIISVENNIDWLEICVQQITCQTQFKETSFTRRPWTLGEISRFVKGQSSEPNIPAHLKRFQRWQDSLATGPLFRFSPEAKSSLSGKLGPLWPALKPIFALLANTYYLINPSKRPQDSEWRGNDKGREIILRNVGPSIKDQYGEAPNMKDYIYAGLKDITAELDAGKTVSAIIIIDGGPRHKIVQEVLELEDRYKNFRPTIFLCDASRVFYHPVLNQRPSGRFIAGSGKTLKGGPVANDVSGEVAQYWVGGDKTAAQLAQQEIWLYQSKN